jgi:pilus assembly protein CpaE
MAHILVIDDDPIYQSMIAHTLEPLGHQVEIAANPLEGLRLAMEIQPDLIITDVVMPEISGYEVSRRLRREPAFANTPILVLTSQAEIQDKLKSFEAGADDHMTKPFDRAELVARVNVFLRRSEAARTVQATTRPREEEARIIGVHSLRGGIGCSTLAVNLSLALAQLWDNPTLLIDLVLIAGQSALMLNTTLKRTWADLSGFSPAELEMEILQSVTTKTESGLQLIAAPTHPTDAERLSEEHLEAALQALRPHYDYIVADLPHDFSGPAVQVLDMADVILLMVAPELASIRAAAAALEAYYDLNYDTEKIKLVMNAIFPRYGLSREKIEQALGMPITMGIPFTPDKFVQAINLGQPITLSEPAHPFSALIEDYAFYLSKDNRKKVKPIQPSEAWMRVYKRFAARKKS